MATSYPTIFLLLLSSNCFLILLSSSSASAKLVQHTFHVENIKVKRLCGEHEIVAVNGKVPGPTIRVNEGDTLLVHVLNNSPYNVTIHWHGVLQYLSGWADGVEYVTQCPIVPGNRYTHKFNITKQEGTLFWHAHSSYLRSTVHGLIVIRPRGGRAYPFPKPHKEFPIILGEWWNSNANDIVNEALTQGRLPNISDAFTINGQPGDLHPCSSKSTHKLKVKQGRRYLLRIVNAALQSILFFKIANHKLTVVATDASYVNPYVTDVVVIAPGQTVDVLLYTNQHATSYYMAARVYQGSNLVKYGNTTTTAILEYQDVSKSIEHPLMPSLPAFNDNETAYKFFSNLTGFTSAPFWSPVAKNVDEEMFVTIGLGLVPCDGCVGPFGQRLAGSMNNISFEPPTKMSMLQSFDNNNVDKIYTIDFPDKPPVNFDFSNPNNTFNPALLMTTKATKAKQFKYNAIVEIVFQDTAFGSLEYHPMHLHGFDFHILAQGYGNYDPLKDRVKFNTINPQIRNTVAVPMGGWAAIRFQANNPGVWFIHCHVEVHLPIGLASAFIVENGPTPSTTLPPPPSDLPQC
ncbi:oxidase [Lithospermum erythrorhizon]|uniref:Laccase n=1 Tax=Lithospermum erythrorhizon TaxID=34254 RepID=A0AAV3P336_LITER